jgi:hypothetical protein
LSDDAVIQRVSANLVPVAVNLYKTRNAPDAGGKLFRSVQRQKDQYQGIWIVSPDGKVLAGHHNIKDHKTWALEVLTTIDEGLQSFGHVEPRQVEVTEQLPFRGQGVQSDGSVSLAIYTRCLHNGKSDGPAVLDSLTLGAEEWAAFAGEIERAGAEWIIPDRVTRKLCRVLSPSSDQSTMPHPEEVTRAEGNAIVREIREGVAWIEYRGRIDASHLYEGKTSHGTARLSGWGLLDLSTKKLKSVRLIFDGTHRAAPPWDSPRQIGAIVEWNRSK